MLEWIYLLFIQATQSSGLSPYVVLLLRRRLLLNWQEQRYLSTVKQRLNSTGKRRQRSHELPKDVPSFGGSVVAVVATLGLLTCFSSCCAALSARLPVLGKVQRVQNKECPSLFVWYPRPPTPLCPTDPSCQRSTDHFHHVEKPRNPDDGSRQAPPHVIEKATRTYRVVVPRATRLIALIDPLCLHDETPEWLGLCLAQGQDESR